MAAPPVGLREEIRKARPELAGVIDSRLVVLADSEARRLGAPSRLATTAAERTLVSTEGLMTDGAGNVAVRITSPDPGALVEHLKELGATSIIAVPDAYLVECVVPINRIPDLGGLVPLGLTSASAVDRPLAMVGSVTSEADVAMQVDRIRASNPTLDGFGRRIGCVSDSYNNLGGAAAGVLSGDLPTVTVLQDATSGGADEGRAMIELMYDLAPGATYLFATAFSNETNFATNIGRLANPLDGNCDVIVDDIVYFVEPYFQNSLVGRAVNDAVNNHDVVYFSAAGNQARQGYERVGGMTFPAITEPTLLGQGIGNLDFDSGPGTDPSQRFVLPSGQSLLLLLQWDDPYYTASGVDTDLDMYLLQGSSLVASSFNDNFANQTPFERIQYFNSSASTQNLDLFIVLWDGPVPGRLKYVRFRGPAPSEHDTTTTTVVSHGAAEKGCAVGAIDYFNQFAPASFTSVGPSTILFNDNGTLKPMPDVRQTPVLSAIQNTNTTFFVAGFDPDGDGSPNFPGTSAAAPHVAAVAAILRQYNPLLNRDQVIAALAGACDGRIGTPGYDNVTGAGSLIAWEVAAPPIPQTPPVFEGGEAGFLSDHFRYRSTGKGRVRVTTAHGPASDSYHIAMDVFNDFAISGAPAVSLNEVDLYLDLTGMSNVELSFRQREFNDTDDALFGTFLDRANGDGVSYSVDGGMTWKPFFTLVGANSTNVYTLHTFNLSTIAAGNGDTLGADVRIRFQQYDDATILSGNAGMAFDDIQVVNLAPPVLDGDANADGFIDVADVTAIHNQIEGIQALPPTGDGDVDEDMDEDLADAAAIIDLLVNGTPIP